MFINKSFSRDRKVENKRISPLGAQGRAPGIPGPRGASRQMGFKAQGLKESRLPTFTEEETLEVARSGDFIGWNAYPTTLVYPWPVDVSLPNYYADKGTAETGLGYIVDSGFENSLKIA